MKALIVADDADVMTVAPICKEHGCGIEMQAFYDPSIYDRDPAIFEKHLSATDGISLRSIHGCFGDLCPGSFDEMVREVARNRYDLSYVAARKVGATHMVVHHGYVPHTSPPDRWVRRARKFWLDFLKDKGPVLRMHMENMLDWDPSVIADLVDSIGSPLLDINLDLGHAYCDSRTDVLNWIRRLDKRIGYVHMHDNHGKEIDRLPLGRGTIPLKEACIALQAVAPEAFWVIETKNDGIQESLEWLSQNGFWNAGNV